MHEVLGMCASPGDKQLALSGVAKGSRPPTLVGCTEGQTLTQSSEVEGPHRCAPPDSPTALARDPHGYGGYCAGGADPGAGGAWSLQSEGGDSRLFAV